MSDEWWEVKQTAIDEWREVKQTVIDEWREVKQTVNDELLYNNIIARTNDEDCKLNS